MLQNTWIKTYKTTCSLLYTSTGGCCVGKFLDNQLIGCAQVIDVLDKETRSRIMSAIRSQSTRPEMLVRKALHRQGFRFRLHNSKLPGTPDLVLRKYRAVVFINGCFWHQHHACKVAHVPKTRSEFWQKKFTRNIVRDQKVLYQLKIMGWRAAILWECGLTKTQKDETLNRLVFWLRWGGEYLEIPVYDEFSGQ